MKHIEDVKRAIRQVERALDAMHEDERPGNIQAAINEWQNRTFGQTNQTIHGMINHLKREVDEFEVSKAAEELADCNILL